jgi:hypothetical protein
VLIEAMAGEDCYQSHGTNSKFQRDQKHLRDIGLAYGQVVLALSDPYKDTVLGAKVIARTKVFGEMLKLTMGTKARNPGAHRDNMMNVWDRYLVDVKKMVDPNDQVSIEKVREHGRSLNQGLSKRYGGFNAVVHEALKGNLGALQGYFTSNPDAASVMTSIISGL